MNGHRVLVELFNIVAENWNPTYSFVLFSTSLITISSILTITLCSENNSESNQRLRAIEYDLGEISSGLQKVQEKHELVTKQINFRFDIQEAEQKDLKEMLEMFENSIFESSSN